MKTAIFYTKALIKDAAFIGSLAIGSLYGIGFLLNAVLFVTWIISILMIVTAFLLPHASKEMEIDPSKFRILQTRTWKTYDILTDAAFVLLLAGLGHFITAGVLLIAKFLARGAFYRLLDEHSQKTPANQPDVAEV